MATNIAGNVCIGQLNACVVRVAALDSDCTPTGGTNGGVVTAALVTMTADPDMEAATLFEPKNACGSILFTSELEARVKRYNISGEFGLFDWELMKIMFGGDLILGAASGSYSGKVIGYADRLYSAAARTGVYLEVITQAVGQNYGPCGAGGAVTQPVAIGHIFGRVLLTPGSSDFTNEVKMLRFTGSASNNPALTNGPWNDYPGTGYIPNSAYVQVGYSSTEYNAILATVGCGYQNIPAGS